MASLGKTFVRAWPCALSGVLMLLAFPPFNLWPLLFVALVPWLWSLRQVPDGRAAWRSGYCLGFVYALGQLLWIDQFVGKWVGSLLIGAIPWLIACLLFALYFGWLGVLCHRAFRLQKLGLIPLAWAGIEVIRSYMPTFAFPWGLYATPLADFPMLAQAAQFGMIYLVSAMLVAVNLGGALIASGERSRGMRWAGQTLALFAGCACLYFLRSTPAMGTAMAIQPGVDAAFGQREDRDEEMARGVNAMMPEGRGPSLVVLPEGMVSAPEMPPQPLFRLPEGTPILFGGRRRAGEKVFQTAFIYDGRWSYADKTRLVIFGEFVPARDIFPALAKSFKLPSGDLVPGEEGVKTFPSGNLRIGPLLCFEGLFPDIAAKEAMQGANVLAVMSIDDWYMGTMAPEQLRQASVWRAIETGLPLVRAASLGYSMGVAANGHVEAVAPLKEPTALEFPLQGVSFRSPAFLLFGFPALSLLVALGLTFAISRKRPSGKKSGN